MVSSSETFGWRSALKRVHRLSNIREIRKEGDKQEYATDFLELAVI
jgi:hypothetical protein